MNELGISVVIPVYNAEKTIEKCINSILNQSFRNLQIICIDDGSSDNSLEILLKLQKNDARMEVYSQTNSGPGATRNKGIQYSLKKYITFVDSDDEIDCNMYSKMFKYMESNNLDCVVCDMKILYPNNTIRYITTSIIQEIINGHDSILEYIIKPLIGYNDKPSEGLPSLCNKLFKRETLYKYNLLIDTKRYYAEDWLFCINYFRYCERVGFIHEPLYHYIRIKTETLSNTFRSNYLEMQLDSARIFRKWFPNLNWVNKEQVDKILFLPIKASEYYRKNLHGMDLKFKFENIYDICFGNKLFNQCAKKNEIWRALLKDRHAFNKYIWKSSTKSVYLFKAKKLLRNYYILKNIIYLERCKDCFLSKLLNNKY